MFSDNIIFKQKQDIECQTIQNTLYFEVIVFIYDLLKYDLFLKLLGKRLKESIKNRIKIPYIQIFMNHYDIISMNKFDDFATFNFYVSSYNRKYNETYNMILNKNIYLTYTIFNGHLISMELSDVFQKNLIF